MNSRSGRTTSAGGHFLGLGKRSWLIVGGWAYLLLSIWVYLSEKPVPVTAEQRRLSEIHSELVALGSDHPWAGRYVGHRGSLELAPRSGYVFSRFYCISPYVATEKGYFRENSGVLAARQSDEGEFREGLLPIRWGRRHYLIRRGELKEFANRINWGLEPRYETQGSYWLREGDEGIPADGFPDLSEPERDLLIARPIDAKIIALGVDHERRKEWAPDAVEIDHDTTIIVDAGRRQGVRPGMVLQAMSPHWGEAEIIRVGESTSLATFRRILDHPSPRRGWKLSTRFQEYRHFNQTDAALQVTVSTTVRVQVAQSFEGIKSLRDRDYLAGAKRSGFSIRSIARISVRAVDSKLRDSASTNELIASLVRGSGGNVNFEVLESENAPGPRRYSKIVEVYRVEWKGHLLERFEFPWSWDQKKWDWAKAGREVERNHHPYAQAVNRIRTAAGEHLLHLPPGGWEKLGQMTVEDLSPEQRAAFRKFWGLVGQYGPIFKAERSADAFESWHQNLEEASAPVLAALKKSDLTGDAEFRRLSATVR